MITVSIIRGAIIVAFGDRESGTSSRSGRMGIVSQFATKLRGRVRSPLYRHI